MKITFDILDSEADIIAAHNGYNDKSGDKEEFVTEFFKQSGRFAIVSEGENAALAALEQSKDSQIDSIKASISF